MAAPMPPITSTKTVSPMAPLITSSTPGSPAWRQYAPYWIWPQRQLVARRVMQNAQDMAPSLVNFGRWYPMPPLWLEGRVWLEFVQLRRDPIFAGHGVPDGRGRHVMLIPGFMAGDRSLDTMRGWLKRNGYRPMRSGIELHMPSSTGLVERPATRI